MESFIEQVTSKVRAEGGRMTAQRRLILDALEDLRGHPTAEEIFDHVRNADPDINLSTVYRTLRWLEENGFVSPRWFEDEKRRERFDPVDRPQAITEHFHFRCRVCNRIIEFDEPLIHELRRKYAVETGAEIENVSFTFYGVCAQCKRNAPDQP